MTNGEKLEKVFPGGICPFSQNWLKAEYKEPTQKTCKTCKTCRNFGSHNGVCDICNPKYNDLWKEKENKSENPTSSDLSSGTRKNSEKLEKDFGESDCISRQAINGYIDYILSHGMGKKKSFDFIKKFVAKLPPVTPQEPKTGEWIENAPEYQNIDPPYICSECGNAHLRKTNYCDQCGARMIELQESEG